MSTSSTVAITGCQVGPNPASGLGIARSLRSGWPDARLIGCDVAAHGTGVHADVFDDALLLPDWPQASAAFEKLLDRAWLIPGLDADVRALAALRHPAILSPSPEAIAATSKPACLAAVDLPLRIPHWHRLEDDAQATYRFGLEQCWRVWLKGPVCGAERVGSWGELQGAMDRMSAVHGPSLFLQQHVAGVEVSLAFAAYRGELLGAAFLEKRLQSETGKAWAGVFQSVPPALGLALRSVVARLGWTGGGELELVREDSGEYWLLEWNPRFPAWIHGATTCGLNLPARLVAAARGNELAAAPEATGGFARHTLEVRLRTDLELPATPARERTLTSLKKASFRKPQPRRVLYAEPIALDGALGEDLRHLAVQTHPTPARVLLARVASERLDAARRVAREHPVQIAYSLKTNPDERFARLALEYGLLAEVISAGEIDWAKQCGWRSDQLIYNGPLALPQGAELGAVFADDLETFEDYVSTPPARVVGLRVRPPSIGSRFGVELHRPEVLTHAVAAMGRMSPQQRTGISLHLASSAIGMEAWLTAADAVIALAGEVQRRSGNALALLSLGGGWTPEQFDALTGRRLASLVQSIHCQLGPGTTVLLEPGKALVQPAFALLTRVRHVRRTAAGCQGILDGGINLVPQLQNFPHRIALLRSGQTVLLPAGPDTLFGPLCMEEDCLSGSVSLPRDLNVGDLIAILDAGAYDASMAHPFAHGMPLPVDNAHAPEVWQTAVPGAGAGSYHQAGDGPSTAGCAGAYEQALAENK